MERDPRTDPQLLAAFARGDGPAFEELYRRHRDWALRAAVRFTGDDDEALDVLQEAFLYLVRAAPELQLRHRLTTLLYPVIKHLARDRWRRRQKAPAPLTQADEPVELPGLPGDVRDWFRGLGPLQQEILTLRFADELSLDEIAAALELPLGTVKSRLHNALRQLREKNTER
ncbi:MAG: RNA polymerase sigma factor [Planctomycetota bacterium]